MPKTSETQQQRRSYLMRILRPGLQQIVRDYGSLGGYTEDEIVDGCLAAENAGNAAAEKMSEYIAEISRRTEAESRMKRRIPIVGGIGRQAYAQHQ